MRDASSAGVGMCDAKMRGARKGAADGYSGGGAEWGSDKRRHHRGQWDCGGASRAGDKIEVRVKRSCSIERQNRCRSREEPRM